MTVVAVVFNTSFVKQPCIFHIGIMLFPRTLPDAVRYFDRRSPRNRTNRRSGTSNSLAVVLRLVAVL